MCRTGDVRLATGFLETRRGPVPSFFNTLRETIGTVENMGRLEYCSDGDWHLFCRDAFHPNDAKVACTQLGYDPIGKKTTIIFVFFVKVIILIYRQVHS